MYNNCEPEVTQLTCTGMAAKVEDLVKQAYCDHIRGTELMPGDGRLYAWYDERCFDSARRAYRCTKAGTGRLLILALRYPSFSSVAIRVSLKAEATPTHLIQLEGGVDHNGFHTSCALTFVLPPLYPPALPSCKRLALFIKRFPGTESEDASLDVIVRVKRDTPRFTNRNLNLPVVVPSRDERELLIGTQMDLLTVVAAESIKILVKDGWSFFKKQVAASHDSSGLLQLNLGGPVLRETVTEDSEITKVVGEAPLRITQAQINELAGLNTRYNQLSIKKKHLLGARSFHPVQGAETETEIELVEQEMQSTQSKIWELLQGSAGIKLAQVEKSVG